MVTDYADYGLKLAEAFQKYLRTGDVRLIEGYSVKELKTAISRLSPHYNNNRLWYREMEKRIDELENDVKDRQEKSREWQERWKEKWLDKIVSFALGYAACLLI